MEAFVFQNLERINMPTDIAHMLICNKAVKMLQDGGEYQQFIDILDSKIYKPFLNLGSLGPALS
jgi:hypothetical protein